MTGNKGEIMKEKKCFHCGEEKFGYGKQSSYGSIYPARVFSFNSQKLMHKICLNCGTVVRSYVLKPEKFIDDRDEQNES